MARVTPNDVRQIMTSDIAVEDAVIRTFIEAANLVITNTFEYDATTSSELKRELERWLTAHMLAMTVHKIAQTEQIGDANIRYTGYFGTGLDATPYGQVLKDMDTSGKMLNMGKREVTVYAVRSFDD